MMESFINTDIITDDEELLEALKHNNKVSSSMKQEIKEQTARMRRTPA